MQIYKVGKLVGKDAEFIYNIRNYLEDNGYILNINKSKDNTIINIFKKVDKLSIPSEEELMNMVDKYCENTPEPEEVVFDNQLNDIVEDYLVKKELEIKTKILDSIKTYIDNLDEDKSVDEMDHESFKELINNAYNESTENNSSVVEKLAAKTKIKEQIPKIIRDIFLGEEFFKLITDNGRIPVENLIQNKYSFIRHFIDNYELDALINHISTNIYINLYDEFADNDKFDLILVATTVIDYFSQIKDNQYDILYNIFVEIYAKEINKMINNIDPNIKAHIINDIACKVNSEGQDKEEE